MTTTNTAAQAQHPDDAAVEKLAESMKQKLAEKRAQGRSGWDTDCTQQRLSDLLRQHVEKGDVLDVANFCAFLFARGERVSATQALDAQRLTKASKDISTVLRVEGMDLEIGSRKLLKEAREAIDAAIAGA